MKQFPQNKRASILKKKTTPTHRDDLCSKTYCRLEESTEIVKLSSKGINQTVMLNNSPMQKYQRVLYEQAKIEFNI